jgi:hypothetical protein
MERKRAGVMGMRLVLRGLIGVPAPARVPDAVLVLTWVADAESGYGRCDPTGGVETVRVVA